MTVDIGGAGALGIGFETTLGTYIAPQKWIPIRSESLTKAEDKIYRTNIRQSADRTGAVKGYQHVEGDVTFEVSADVLPYFLYIARTVPVKTGAMAPWTYTFAPAHTAKATTATGTNTRKTATIHIIKGGHHRGFLGCSVGQLAFTLDSGLLMCTASIIGVNEPDADQTTATPAWTTNTPPFGPGDITLEIPTGTPRGDADTFSMTINDNLAHQNRLNGQRFAAYQNWGERETTLSAEADFDNLTDYNVFTGQTQQAITFKATHSASDEITIVYNAAIQDGFMANLSGLGDIVRMAMEYHTIHATTESYSIVVKTAESIT